MCWWRVGLRVSGRVAGLGFVATPKVYLTLRTVDDITVYLTCDKLYMLWIKLNFGAKFLKLVQFLFSFVMYSLS